MATDRTQKKSKRKSMAEHVHTGRDRLRSAFNIRTTRKKTSQKPSSHSESTRTRNTTSRATNGSSTTNRPTRSDSTRSTTQGHSRRRAASASLTHGRSSGGSPRLGNGNSGRLVDPSRMSRMTSRFPAFTRRENIQVEPGLRKADSEVEGGAFSGVLDRA